MTNLDLFTVYCGALTGKITVTITAAPQFIVEPACVQSCLFWSTGILQDYLLSDLGCSNR